MKTPVPVDADLVRKLVDAQFPHWSGQQVAPVEFSGWDHRTFHLGDAMLVRLPSAAEYAEQVLKEETWLAKLAPTLPLPIPRQLALGRPTESFPWNWAVYAWLPGGSAREGRINNLPEFATSLAEFLTALGNADATGGPLPGQHNFYRGGSLSVYDQQTRESLSKLAGKIDVPLATSVWEMALASSWRGAPVWFHGDVSLGNLLVQDGQLSAVIDFGTAGIGDPACDLAIAWTDFVGDARAAFRSGYQVDAQTWARGRGWTLWKAAIVAAEMPGTDNREVARSFRIIDEVLADHRELS